MTTRKERISQALKRNFLEWLSELTDDQAAALYENWDNVMNDAALERIGSWIIANRVIAALRGDDRVNKAKP